MLSKLIYDDKHKLVYCYIPKISSSQWKRILGILSGMIPRNMTNVQLRPFKLSPHEERIHHFLSNLPADEIKHRLETYTSFMFARHPLERLVSGYRDKFKKQLMRRPWQMKHAIDMIAHSEGREPWQVAEEGPPGYVTFEQFARWVADAPPTNLSLQYQEGPHNEHWKPMTDLCHPCSVPYTMLGKFETMQEDARLLFELANISSVSLPKQDGSSVTSAITGRLMASLQPETLKGVLRHYLQDFVLFGYRPDSVFPDFSGARGSNRAALQELHKLQLNLREQ